MTEQDGLIKAVRSAVLIYSRAADGLDAAKARLTEKDDLRNIARQVLDQAEAALLEFARRPPAVDAVAGDRDVL